LKQFLYLLAAASALPLCACANPALPTAPSAIAGSTAFVVAEAFDQTFYRFFAQNGYESPNRLEPVRRLPGPLRLYLRTEDNAGRAIDRTTLDATERVLVASAGIWSGEQFGVTTVVRGTGTREKVPGWITIKWASTAASDRCGRSTVGIDGGFIEFNDLGPCSCGKASRVYSRVVRHELGHAMGYYHTDQISDVMYGREITPDSCDLEPSERERLYAKIVYGN
jgi:hypothetical protein